MAAGVLGVVMPVYNEGDWIRRSVEALHAAANAAGWRLRVVVVDDGSTDSTVEILDGMAARGDIELLRQPNSGRFAARLAGLRALGTSHALLLDARVLLDPGALVVLRRHLGEDPGSRWNAHVRVATEGNPWAAFWSGLTKVGWRKYFSRPRPVSFGVADFNAYPKGTGAFAAPTGDILAAAGGFASLFSDERFASDDTRLLRGLAESADINIDPEFSCLYFGKDTFGKWVKQSYFRGTTFVDGYVGSRRNAALVLLLLGATLAGAAVFAVRQPTATLGLAITGAAGAGVVAANSGGDRRESGAVAGLVVPFAAVFGAGFVRGLLMALRAR